MANVLAPFGFSHVGIIDGSAPNYAGTEKKISSANATAIYFGDPVTQLNTGYITQSTAGTTQVHGIFVGCKYLSVSRGYTVWSRYWPGSDANGDVTAFVINTPQATFRVQANAQCTFASVGNNANFALGTGNTATGNSGASLDVSTIATTSTLPFRIVALVDAPPGAPGTDTTTAYNYVLVTFNNQDFKSLTGI